MISVPAILIASAMLNVASAIVNVLTIRSLRRASQHIDEVGVWLDKLERRAKS